MNPLRLLFTTTIIAALTTHYALAQDTSKKSSNLPAVVSIGQEPVFPGGIPAFNKYLIKNVKYPEVAKVVGLSGKVYVSFIVERDGSVSDAKPVRCMGAGCESEAVRVVSSMPNWIPGSMDGKPVRVQYTVPINFFMTYDDSKITTRIKDLRNSDFGFFFYIKGKTYTLDEAQAILGKTFDPSTIASVEDFHDPQYNVPNKKGNYLIIMKNS